MKSKLMHLSIGIFVSVLAILELHDFLFIDWCLDQGGVIDKSSSACIQDQKQKTMVFTPVLGVVYFIVAAIITMVIAAVSMYIASVLNKNEKQT
jgi:uncharacterized membrane protein